MDTLDQDFATGLLDSSMPPCLSLYQPTHRHHPANAQDPIRFGQLVKALEATLSRDLAKNEVKELLQPFRELLGQRDFWNHTLDGLAVLGSADTFRVYRLQRPVNELAVVADTFHLKPLLRIRQSADRYHVLGLDRHKAMLFEGNRDSLLEVELAPDVPRNATDAIGDELTEPHQTVASYGGSGTGKSAMFHGHGSKDSEVDTDAQRFFRAVDRAITEHHSKPSGLPLILAALPEHHHMFHQLSHNPLLVEKSLDVHPEAISSVDELRQRIWRILEPVYLKRLAKIVEEFGEARANGVGDGDVAGVAQAAVAGRVAKLLIDADRVIPGRIDAESGRVEYDEMARTDVDDILDDLGMITMKTGGEVVVVPSEQMPTSTGVAAVYRY